MDGIREMMFCTICGMDINLNNPCACSELGISYIESLSMESNSFDSLMSYPRNFFLIDNNDLLNDYRRYSLNKINI